MSLILLEYGFFGHILVFLPTYSIPRSDEVKDLKEKCFLSNDIRDYWYVSQGKLTVPSIDDREDMQFANEAFDILGFSEEMKYNVNISAPDYNHKLHVPMSQVFKNTACMMHMGNMTKDFVPVGKEEQAEIKDESNAEKVADLLAIDKEWMITYFCKPKLKVSQSIIYSSVDAVGHL